MISSTPEIITANPIANPDRQWEIGFVHGEPAAEGVLKSGEWNLDFSTLFDTEMYQSAVSRLPAAAAIFEESILTSMAQVERIGRSSATLTNAGKAFWNIGNFEAASELFQEASDSDWNFGPGRILLGRAHLQNKQYALAFETVESLISDGVYGASATIVASDARFRDSRTEEALSLLKDGIKRWPNNAMLRLNMGIVLVARKEIVGAAKEFRGASHIDPFLSEAHHGLALCYIHQGMDKKAIREFRLGLSVGSMSVKGVRNLGRLLYDRSEYQEAIKLFSKHVANYSADLLSKFLLSSSYFAVDEFYFARQQLLEILNSVEKDPTILPEELNYDALLNNIGACLVRENQIEEGIRWVERAYIEKGSTSEIILCNLIRISFGNTQLDRARYLLDELLSLHGKSAAERNLRANYFTVNGNYSRAFSVLAGEDALEILDPEGYTTLAFLYTEWKSEPLAAIEIVRRGLRRFPRNPLLLNALAYNLIIRGLFDQAREIMAFKEWSHTLPIAIATEGFLHLKEDNFHEGVTSYNNAKNLADSNLKPLVEQKKRLEMAQYYLRLGQRQQAVTQLKHAIAEKSLEPYYKEQAQDLLNTLE